MQVVFGARGVTGLELTRLRPARPLHSGHYGNWAPNPAVAAGPPLAGLRDDDGRILIPGFYDDVRPLTESRAAAPRRHARRRGRAAQRELGLGRDRGRGRAPGRSAIMLPGAQRARPRVGPRWATRRATPSPPRPRPPSTSAWCPTRRPRRCASASRPTCAAAGYHVVHEAPDAGDAARPPADRPPRVGRRLPGGPHVDGPAGLAGGGAAVEEAAGGPVIRLPTLGGSVPMYLFTDTLKAPVIGVPIVNHDNNQHAANENLRLQNLWDGIEVYAALFARLDW